jgi:hypothetical protein
VTNINYVKLKDRRAFLVAATALPLSGCDTGPYGIGWNQWGKALSVATGFETPAELAREQVEQIPFATIGYRVGDSPESLLILAEKSGANFLWTSSQRLAVVTANGRILQTSGFHWNLGSTNFVEPDLMGTPLWANSPKRTSQRLCDFADINKFQIQIDSEFSDQKDDVISILGTDIPTIRMTEECRCKALDWNFENFHWIDRATGFVWQTAQYVHPNEAHFTVTVLRPAA